jgi:hypothetical protein
MSVQDFQYSSALFDDAFRLVEWDDGFVREFADLAQSRRYDSTIMTPC